MHTRIDEGADDCLEPHRIDSSEFIEGRNDGDVYAGQLHIAVSTTALRLLNGQHVKNGVLQGPENDGADDTHGNTTLAIQDHRDRK